MERVNLNLKDYSCPIYVGSGIFSQINTFLVSKGSWNNLFIIIDSNVARYWDKLIKKTLKEFKGKKFYLFFNASEKAKSLFGLTKIYSELIENHLGRDTLLISIGGGITGDLAGFAASTFMRGIPIVHVPTTLLSAVDSSVGGKTAVNFKFYKNIIGSFHQPEFVLIDYEFLKTLPKREMISGAGELIKYAFIISNEFYKHVDESIEPIINKSSAAIEKTIVECLRFKASVVKFDEKEDGLRKILNFGHTFAHAFERELKNKISHGEAVVAGVTCALLLSHEKNWLSNDKLKDFLKLPLKLKLNSNLKSVTAEEIYDNMFADKKTRNHQPRLVLLRDIGEVVIDVTASKKEILSAVKNGINLLNFG